MGGGDEAKKPLLNGEHEAEAQHTSLEVNELIADGDGPFRDPADEDTVPEER